MPTSSRVNDPAATAVVAAFFFAGIVTVLLGPILPELRARWDAGEAEVAPLFVAQFASSSLGAVLSGFRLRRSIAAGYWLVGLGLAVLAMGGQPLALPAMALLGLGLGLALAASNLFVAHGGSGHPVSGHSVSGHRGASVARLNVVWGIGAMSSALLIAAARGVLSLPATLGCLATVSALVGLFLWWVVPDDLPTDGLSKEGLDVARAQSLSEVEPKADAGFSFLAITAAMLFLYVGAENAVGGWLVTLADQLGGDRSTASLLIGSGFWAAILVGRAATAWALRSLSEPTLFKLCLLLAMVGTTLLLLSGSRPVLAAAAVLVGLGLAPIFPLTVSLLAAATAASRSRSAGWVMACGGLGGAALPWLTGRLGGAVGTVQHGFLVPLAGLVLLATLYGLGRARVDDEVAS